MSAPPATPEEVHAFLHPRHVALVGRIDRSQPERVVADKERRRWGDGRFSFINPAGGMIDGLPIHLSLADVTADVDLVVLSIGNQQLDPVLRQCAERGVRNVVVFTGGFGEVGAKGAEAERRLAAVTQSLGMRVLGPNTNSNTFESMPKRFPDNPARIGLVTQSGNQGRAFVEAEHLGVDISRWVAVGNELDLEAADFIRYFAWDPETSVIACYIEGFRDGAKLRSALHAANEAGKPVVCLKVGRTAAGQKMAASHTGHLVGDDRVIDGLFRQYGVVRVDDIDELMDTAALFAHLALRPSRNVAVYGASGGVTTLIAENAERAGLLVPTLGSDSQDAIATFLPDYLHRSNPVDNGMIFLQREPRERRAELLTVIAADPAVDVVVVGNNMGNGPVAAAVVEDCVTFAQSSDVPLVCIWQTPAGTEVFSQLASAGIPIFRSSRNATAALAAHACYLESKKGFRERRPQLDGAEVAALAGVTGVVPHVLVRQLLTAVGIPVVQERIAHTPDEARSCFGDIGGPVVMKIVSNDILHRSDAGLVQMDVRTGGDAARVYTEFINRAARTHPGATVDGVSLQTQVPAGVELLVGATCDPLLGSAVVLGTGGVYAEILDDVAVCPVPLDRSDADDLVRSLKGYPMLQGVRGRPPVDVESVVDVLLAVARLAEAAGPRLTELDLNPVIVGESGAMAVDWLAIAAGETASG